MNQHHYQKRDGAIYRNTGFRLILGDVFTALDGSFDGWREYVVSQRDRSFYNDSGEYIVRKTDANATEISLPRSYLFWQRDGAAIAARLRRGYIMDVIGEIPKQSGTVQDRQGVLLTWNIKRTQGLNK